MKKYPMNARSELLVKKVFVYGFTWREVEDFFLINRTFLYDELKNYFLKMPDSEERLRRFDEKIKEMAKNYGKENDEAFLQNENVRNYIEEGIKSEKAVDFLVKNAKMK